MDAYLERAKQIKAEAAQNNAGQQQTSDSTQQATGYNDPYLARARQIKSDASQQAQSSAPTSSTEKVSDRGRGRTSHLRQSMAEGSYTQNLATTPEELAYYNAASQGYNLDTWYSKAEAESNAATERYNQLKAQLDELKNDAQKDENSQKFAKTNLLAKILGFGKSADEESAQVSNLEQAVKQAQAEADKKSAEFRYAKQYKDYRDSSRTIEDAYERGLSYKDISESYSKSLDQLNKARATAIEDLNRIRNGAGYYGAASTYEEDKARQEADEKDALARLEAAEKQIQRVTGMRDYAFARSANDKGAEAVIRQGEELARTAKEQYLAGNMPDPTSNADYRTWVENNPGKTARDYAEQQYADREPNNLWTQEEKNRYFILMTDSPERAFQYAVEINSAINSETNAAAAERFAKLFPNYDMSEEARAGRSGITNALMRAGNAASDVAGIAGGVATGPVKLFNWLDNIYQNNERGGYYAGNSTPRITDYTDRLLGQNTERLNSYGTIRDNVPVLGGKGLGDLYQLVESVAQSMAYGGGLSKAFGVGATTAAGLKAAQQAAKLSTGLIFFGQAADSSYNEYVQRGMSREQAAVGSFFAGLAEAMGEELSIDHLISGDISEGLAKYVAKQSFIEASEEGFTNVLNLFGDELAARMTGGESKMRQDIEALKRSGMSEEDAKRQVWKEFVDGTVFDMLGGAISGGLSSGAYAAPNALYNYVQNRNSRNQQNTQTAQPTQPTQAEASQRPTTRNPLYEALNSQTPAAETATVAENATTEEPAPATPATAQAVETPAGEVTTPTAETTTQPQTAEMAQEQMRQAETAQERLDRAQARYAELERAFDNGEVSEEDAPRLAAEMEQRYNEIQELTPLADRERQSAADVQTQQARVQNGEVSKGYGTPENHIDRRTPESVGNTGVKSFQFDNPQLHGYYVEAAQALFDEVQRAEDAALGRAMSRERGSAITGPIRRLMDMGLTKPQIVKCLQDIIADNGQENYAAAKRVELVLNDMLTNGWQGQYGRNDWHEANADYIAAKDAIDGGIKADSWEKYLADHELSLITGEVTEEELRAEWEQMHPQKESATVAEPETVPETSQPVDTPSTGTEQSAQNATDSRGYTGPLVETQDRVFETNLSEEEKQVPGLTAEEARHVQHHDAEVDARAKARIAAGAEQARAELLAAESWSDEDTATAGYLIQAELEAADNAATEQERANIYKRLAELKKQWNKQGTEEGRALRQRRRFVAEDIVTSAAETLYGDDSGRGGKALRKLNPQAKDNIMRTVRQYAQRFNDIQKNHPGDAASIIQLIKDVSVQRRTTGLFSNQNSHAVDFALEQVAQQEGGVDFLNDLLTTQIKSIASDYIKPGIIDQLKSFRFMAMLSNPATTITNLSANTTFGSIMESIASAPSAMMDNFMEHFTGQRTVPLETVKQAKTGWNGFRDAGLRSFLEVTLDAEAEQASYGYKEIKGSTFKMVGNPLERFLATMQKWQGYALKSTDQAAKGSARAKVSEGLNRLADRGRTNADNVDALAEQEAKYRTLQTEGKVSNALYAVRKAADDLFHFGNDKTGKYGIGTDIMPFAQVPANAVSASLEAHPVIGGAKAVADTLGVIHDALNGESVDPEKQARAARAWGRAANGAAVAAAFAALAARGHIRDKEDDDKDVQAQRRAEGQGTLQLNVSSALRDIAGQGNEAREGDKYIDFSWIPQLNLLANFGVDLYNAYRDNGKITMSDIAGASWDSLADSFMEFPAVSKVSSLIQTWKYSENEGWGRLGELAATSAAETASSILVPNAVRAAAAGADPYERDVYNTDTYGQGIKNNLIAGIPGLRQTLPERLDTFGNPVKNSGGPLHFLDKTVIPGNIEVDNRQSAESKAIEDLIKATGDKSLQPSRNAPGKLTIDGEDVQLSAADKRLYKQKEGQLSQRYIGELMKDDIFKSLSPEDQAAAVKELYSAAKEQAKSAVADSLGKKDKPGAFQKLLSGVVNPGNGTDNDIPKLQSRNVAQYTSYDVAYKNAVKRGDTEAIDNLLMRYSRLNGNTQAVLAAKNPGENDGNGINNLLKYSQAGVSSKSYFAVKDAINDAQIELDKSAKTGGDVKLWGLGSADIPASEKDKLVESGAFNLSSAAKNTYTILRNAGLSASEIATWFDNADYFSKGEGIEAKSDGSLNAYEVATAISKMGSLSEPEKSALYLEFKAALQEKGSPYDTWKEKTYEQALGQSSNYGRTVGKPKQESSGNVFYDYYKERANAQK